MKWKHVSGVRKGLMGRSVTETYKQWGWEAKTRYAGSVETLTTDWITTESDFCWRWWAPSWESVIEQRMECVCICIWFFETPKVHAAVPDRWQPAPTPDPRMAPPTPRRPPSQRRQGSEPKLSLRFPPTEPTRQYKKNKCFHFDETLFVSISSQQNTGKQREQQPSARPLPSPSRTDWGGCSSG